MAARTKALLGLTAVGLCASALLPAAAQAQARGASFTFCNRSKAPEYVAFPYRGGFSSYVEQPDHCWHATLRGRAHDEAVGYRRVNGHWLAVATKYFRDSGTVRFYF